jgi:hypothetical protein
VFHLDVGSICGSGNVLEQRPPILTGALLAQFDDPLLVPLGKLREQEALKEDITLAVIAYRDSFSVPKHVVFLPAPAAPAGF